MPTSLRTPPSSGGLGCISFDGTRSFIVYQPRRNVFNRIELGDGQHAGWGWSVRVDANRDFVYTVEENTQQEIDDRKRDDIVEYSLAVPLQNNSTNSQNPAIQPQQRNDALSRFQPAAQQRGRIGNNQGANQDGAANSFAPSLQ